MSSAGKSKLAQLWQLPLLIVSLLLFAVAGYLFVNSSPGLTVRRRIEVARLYVERDRPDAAIEQLNRLLSGERLDQPSEAAVHLLLAEALASAGKQQKLNIAANHQRIIDQSQLALSQGAKPSGALHRRIGESYLALDRGSDAVAQFRKAIALDPLRTQPLRRKVIEIQIAEGDVAAALAGVEEYLADKELANSERAWALGEQSQILADRGEFTAARAMIADAVRLSSDPISQAEANYRLAYFSWKLGKTDDAQRLATLVHDQLHGRHPLDADACYLLGRVRQEKNDLPGAMAAYQIALSEFPEARVSLQAHLAKGLCQILSGDDAGGVIELRTAVGQRPRGAARDDALSALNQAEQALAIHSSFQGAIDALALQQELEPKQPSSFHAQLASLYEKRAEQVERSIVDAVGAERVRRSQLLREMLVKSAEAHMACARSSFTAGGANSAQEFWAGIDLYDRCGSLAQAIAALELVIAERPGDPIAADALLRLGQAQRSAGANDKAIAAYAELQSRFAKSEAARKSALPLAQAYIAKGPAEYQKAENVLLGFLAALGKNDASEQFSQSMFELAQLYYRNDRFEKTMECLATLLERVPSGPLTAQAQFLVADSNRKAALKIQAAVASSAGGTGELTQAVAARKKLLGQAKDTYDKVIELYQHAAPNLDVEKRYEKLAHFYRADCAFELAAYEEAIRLYDAAALRYQDEPAALAAYVQIVNSYCALGKMDQARLANERAKALLRRMPAEAFNDGGFTMPKAYWEQWLKWTSTAGAW